MEMASNSFDSFSKKEVEEMRREMISNQKVLNDLHQKFGNNLTLEVISQVAESCKYNVLTSTTTLMEIIRVNFLNKDPAAPDCTKNTLTQTNAEPCVDQQLSKDALLIEETVNVIKNGYKVLVLLRGLPGSGKSFLGRQIVDQTISSRHYSDHIFSADDFFTRNGKYVFNGNKIHDAHDWNKGRVQHNVRYGVSPIIVDNTNTQLWEMEFYVKLAIDSGYLIRVLQPVTKWRFNCQQLQKRNMHGLPPEKIREMLDRYDKDLTSKNIAALMGLQYKENPQLRKFPPVLVPKTKANGNTSTYQSQVVELTNDEDDTEVLQPSRQQTDPVNTVQSSPQQNNVMDQVMNVEKAWGINEKAIQSWDFVTPLGNSPGGTSFVGTSPIDTFSEALIDLTMESDDIVEVPKSDAASNTSFPDFFLLQDKDEYEHVRYLTSNSRSINSPDSKLSKRKSGTFDKGCNTEDDLLKDRNEDLRRLKEIFYNVPACDVVDMYNRCKEDFDMTVDIFVEDGKDYVVLNQNNDDNLPEFNQEGEPSKKLRLTNEDHNYEELKKFITNKLASGENYLREKLSQITINKESKECIDPQPSTSSFPDEDFELVESDLEFEEDTNAPSETITNNDMIELSLGDAFVGQLEKEFGDPNHKYPKGFLPIVQVPKSLARQLYAFYVESVYQQMDTQNLILEMMVGEDEEFARKLQAEEETTVEENLAKACGSLPANNEQVDTNQWGPDEWKNVTPDDFNEKMIRKKLYHTFPTVDRSLLVELLHANDSDYKKTVSDILGLDSVDVASKYGNIVEAPLNQSTIDELKQVYSDCSYSNEQLDENNQSATFYREKAAKHTKKRRELFQKAQEYYQRNMKEVATFYSHLARKETQFYDQANSLAATCLLDEHAHRLQNFDTIDLHYFYVQEAIQNLDIFIDRNINLLKGSSKTSQSLSVITGRGNRSKNGLPKIKPAVIARLSLRKIQHVELNPGLLKIKVNRNSLMTNDIRS